MVRIAPLVGLAGAFSFGVAKEIVDDVSALLQHNVRPHDVTVDRKTVAINRKSLWKMILEGFMEMADPEEKANAKLCEDLDEQDDLDPYEFEFASHSSNGTLLPVSYKPLPKLDIDTFRDVDIERESKKAFLARVKTNKTGTDPQMQTEVYVDESVRCASDDPESDYYCMFQPDGQNESLSIRLGGFKSSYEDWKGINISFDVQFHYPWFLAAGPSVMRRIQATCPLCKENAMDMCNVTVMNKTADIAGRPLCSDLVGKDSLFINTNVFLNPSVTKFVPNEVTIELNVKVNNSIGQIQHTQAWVRVSSTSGLSKLLTRRQGREIFENYRLTAEETAARKQQRHLDGIAQRERDAAKKAKEDHHEKAEAKS